MTDFLKTRSARVQLMQLAEDFEQFCLTPDGGRVVGCHMAAVVT